jgi:hypothetical protein
MSVLKRHSLNIRVGYWYWIKLGSYDGTYLHHEPVKVYVVSVLEGVVSYKHSIDNNFVSMLDKSQFHDTKLQAWTAWIQNAKTSGMRQVFVDQVEYHIAGVISQK